MHSRVRASRVPLFPPIDLPLVSRPRPTALIAALALCACAAGIAAAATAPHDLAGSSAARSPAVGVLDGSGGAIFIWNDPTGPLLAQRVSGAGAPQWSIAGVPLSTVVASEQNAAIVADGAGGVIVAWLDARSGQLRVYAQRLDIDGATQWDPSGVALNAAPSGAPDVASDGAGGAFVAWTDTRGGSASGAFVQHLSAAGTPQWTTGGVTLATTADAWMTPRALADGAGGAIVCWNNQSLAPRTVLAQHLDASGAAQWTPSGIAVLSGAGVMQMAPDGAGGIIASCVGDSGARFVAQRVTSTGQLPWGASGTVSAQFTSNVTWGLFPAIVTDGTGGAIVAWYGGTQALGDQNLYAQRLDAAGQMQWGATGRLVASVGSTGQLPWISTDGSGGALIAWIFDANVYAQRLDASGTPQWLSTGVPVCTAPNIQVPLAILPDGAGGAILGWIDHRNSDDVYAQRLSPTGSPEWRANGAPVYQQDIGQRHPAIVADGAGGVLAAWMEVVDGIYQIHAQHRNGAGQPSGPVRVLCGVDSEKGGPFAVSDGAGGIIVAWADTRSNVDAPIYAQRMDSSGVFRWTPDGLQLGGSISGPSDLCPDGAGGAFFAFVTGRTMGAQHVTADGGLPWGPDGAVVSSAPASLYRWHSSPCVTSDRAGGVIVTWVDTRWYDTFCIHGCGTAIYAQRLDASGAALWTTDGIELRSPINYAYGSPEIAADGMGGAFVVWEDSRAGTNVYGQHLAADGSLAWIADGMLLCSSAAASHPALVASATGQAILAWADSRSGTGLDLYAQHLGYPTPGLWAATGVPLCVAGGDQTAPVLLADGLGGAVAAWTDSRPDAALDVYAQRVDATGTLLWNAGGVAVSTGPGGQVLPVLAPESDGGAIVAWQDSRGGFSPVIGYERLGPNGASMWAGVPVGVDVPRGRPALALAGIRPNPARRDFTVSFSLPDAGAARLELLDLAGRRLASLEVGGRVAGPQSARLEPSRLRPGLYLVRLVHASGTRVAKAVVVR
jgi:hypothetical protein